LLLFVVMMLMQLPLVDHLQQLGWPQHKRQLIVVIKVNHDKKKKKIRRKKNYTYFYTLQQAVWRQKFTEQNSIPGTTVVLAR